MAETKVPRKPTEPVELVANQINGTRVGDQIPTVNTIPIHADTSAGDEAIEFLNLVGFELDPWQEHILRVMLHKDSKGKWAATEVGMVIPRQSGKTVITELRELVGLFLFGEQVIIHSAQLFSTAKESFLRQSARIKRCPDLMDMVSKFRTGNDNVSIELKSGSRLLYQARGSDPARGFSADLLVYDESYGLTAEVIAASMMTLSARPNPQIVYASSTGLDDSDFLRGVRERGINRAPRLAFFEWAADPDCDPSDVDQWYKANPALGIRISEDFVRTEGEALGWGKQFKRERLGLWADTSMRDVLPPEWWAACSDAESLIAGDEIVAAVDVSPYRDFASISVCGFTASGKRQVEVIETGSGTDWVTGFLKKFSMSSNPPVRVAIQGGGSPGSLISHLLQEGFDLIVLGQADIGRATGEFFDLVRDGQIVHLGDPLVELSLGNATRYNIGSKEGETESPAWGFARKDSHGSDITPVVSCCYANYGMSKFLAERAVDEAKQPVGAHKGAAIGGRIW